MTSFKESKYDRSSKSSCRGECCLGVDEYWPNYRLELTGGQSVRRVFLVEQCNSEKKKWKHNLVEDQIIMHGTAKSYSLTNKINKNSKEIVVNVLCNKKKNGLAV